MGVIGVDLVCFVFGCVPRRRGPRKKRQKYKREHSKLRARGLVLRRPSQPRWQVEYTGVTKAKLPNQTCSPSDRDTYVI